MKRLLFLVSLLAFSTFALADAINLNVATQAQLAALSPIGAAKAKAIVDFRTANGCFKNLSDLLKVEGMTQPDVDAIQRLVVVGSCPRGGPPSSNKAQT